MYEVEKILEKREKLDRKTGRKTFQYKVKWNGYDIKQSTWQPYKNVKNCKDILDEFNQKEEKKKKLSSKKIPLKNPKQKSQCSSKESLSSENYLNKLSKKFFKEKQNGVYYSSDEEQQKTKQNPKDNIFDGNSEQLSDEEMNVNKKNQQLKAKNNKKAKPIQKKEKKSKPQKQQANIFQQQFEIVGKQEDNTEEYEIQRPIISSNPTTSIFEPFAFQKDQKDKKVMKSFRSTQTPPTKINSTHKGVQVDMPYYDKEQKKNPTQKQVKAIISRMHKDRNGIFWFTVRENGLKHLRKRNWIVEHYPKSLILFYQKQIDFTKEESLEQDQD